MPYYRAIYNTDYLRPTSDYIDSMDYFKDAYECVVSHSVTVEMEESEWERIKELDECHREAMRDPEYRNLWEKLQMLRILKSDK